MKKSEEKIALVKELTDVFQNLNVQKLYEEPGHKTSKDWLAEVASILKNLDEGDFQAFLNLRQHLYDSIPIATRKHATEQIDGFVRQKVREYARYDFSYLDRTIAGNPEDISNYIHDKELRDRCLDLLEADSKYDRVINQATLVLEDRIRTKAKITDPLEGVRLVNTALNPDPDRTILQVSTDTNEQQGFCDICRGIMLTFRNPTHHHLTDKITREEAFKLCAFIDTLLPLIENAIIPTRTTNSKVEGKIQSVTPKSLITVTLLDSAANWANYATGHHVWSSFRIGLMIDNYNNSRADYVSVTLSARLVDGTDWQAKHFLFQGIGAPDEEFRIEANEMRRVHVFVSDYLPNSSAAKSMPDIDKRTVKLLISTRSGASFLLQLEDGKITSG